MTDDTDADQSPKTDTATDKTAEQPAKNPEAEKPQGEGPKRKARRWPWVFGALVILFVAGAGLGIYFLPQLKANVPFLSALLPEEGEKVDLGPVNAEIAALRHEVDRLTREARQRDDRIAALGSEDTRLATAIARVEALAQSIDMAALEPAPTEPATPEKPEPQDIAPKEASPKQASPELAKAQDQLAARLDMLMLRVGQLESAFVPLSEKVGRQDGAEAARARLESRTESMGDTITMLTNRLGRLEASASADAKQALLVLTYGAVRRAAQDGRPFMDEVEALQSLGLSDGRAPLKSEIEQLAAFAPQSTPTLSDLSARLPDRINAILDAARLPENANWWQKFWAKARGLITLRPVGDVAGEDLSAILARAENRLRFGDLEATAAELDSLTGQAGAAAEPWLQDARRRLALDAALEAVDKALRTMARKTPDLMAPDMIPPPADEITAPADQQEGA
jgi:hypothetical protein